MILLTKNCEWSLHAGRLADIVFGNDLYWIKGPTLGRPAIPEMPDGTIISFLSPWVVRNTDLLNSKLAINFHPASADYPGIGCYNFALHEKATRYGAVCHFMEPKVDTGVIIEERLFPVLPRDTVETLKFRTMIVMLAMFQEIILKIAAGEELHGSGVPWTRKPFTRKQLDQLYADFPNTRATRYPDAA